MFSGCIFLPVTSIIWCRCWTSEKSCYKYVQSLLAGRWAAWCTVTRVRITGTSSNLFTSAISAFCWAKSSKIVFSHMTFLPRHTTPYNLFPFSNHWLVYLHALWNWWNKGPIPLHFGVNFHKVVPLLVDTKNLKNQQFFFSDKSVRNASCKFSKFARSTVRTSTHEDFQMHLDWVWRLSVYLTQPYCKRKSIN